LRKRNRESRRAARRKERWKRDEGRGGPGYKAGRDLVIQSTPRAKENSPLEKLLHIKNSSIA